MTEIVARIRADSSEVETALSNLKNLSSEFSTQLASGMKSAAAGGKELDDVLKKIALNIAGIALDAGLKPITGIFSNFFQGLLGMKGGAGVGNIKPFADGGIISAPGYFPLGGGRMGVAGEAGPEAILPLQRSTDGTLGIAVASGKSSPINVVFNITTSDALSFRKSESQITAMLARAVRRGERTF